MTSPSTRVPRHGFTLIEVLVVIAILLTLGALVFMGVGGATLAARKVESINNIKQLSAISISDAGENNGVFPDIHFGNLPFWFSWEWRERNGITRGMAYSSANECWTKNGVDICSNPKTDLWEYGGKEESSLFAYACLIENEIWTESGTFVEPKNWLDIKDDVTNEDAEEGSPDRIRWTPSRMAGQKVAYPILWIDVAMVWNQQRIANFMAKQRDPEPKGTHIGYLDGHVEWVRGADMKVRFSTPQLSLSW
jgi:prepilin-type N-terminal cleavage/methylation domain-containing protein/prepilin-type processing-associated H-X9-DG protein